jgi:hypothetical protein
MHLAQPCAICNDVPHHSSVSHITYLGISMLNWLKNPAMVVLALLATLPAAISYNFYRAHSGNASYADEWCDAVPMVIEAADGEMTPARLFAQHNAHRIFLLNVLTVAGYYFGDWNLQRMTLVNFVFAGIGLFVMVSSLRQQNHVKGALLFVALVLLSMNVFALRQRVIWMWYYAFPYVTNVVLPLISVWVLLRMRQGWPAFAVAILLVVMGAYSIGSGFIALFMFPLFLWLAGYGRWRYQIAWAGITAIAVGLFFYGYSDTPTNFCDGYISEFLAPSRFTPIERLLAAPLFVLRTGGAALLAHYYVDWQRAILVGSWLLAVLGMNLIYNIGIWRRAKDGRPGLIWLMLLVQAGGSITMIGAGRANPDSVSLVFLSNYAFQASMVICGIVGLAVASTQHIMDKERPRIVEHGLMYLNAVSIVLFVFLYFNATANAQNIERYPNNADIYYYPYTTTEHCLQDYFFTDGEAQSPPACYELTAFWDDNATEEEYRYYMRRMAELRISAFADLAYQLPQEYEIGQPIVVNTPLAAQQLPVEDILGRQIAESDIARVVESSDDFSALVKQGAQHTFVDSAPLSQEFWYFDLDNAQDDHAYIWHPRFSDNDLRIRLPYQLTPMYLGGAIRPTTDQQPDRVFGEQIRMIDWQIRGDSIVQPCDTVTVDSWWVADEQAALADYTLSMVVTQPDGTGAIGQSDTELTPYMGTQAWEPDKVYWDTRTVEIPCDTAPGEYPIIQSVYFYLTPDAPLDVTDGDGESLGTWAYLTTVQVR